MITLVCALTCMPPSPRLLCMFVISKCCTYTFCGKQQNPAVLMTTGIIRKPFSCLGLSLPVVSWPHGPEWLNQSLTDAKRLQKKRREKGNRNNDKSRGCRPQWQEAPPGSVWSQEPRAWMSLCQQQQEMGSGTLLNPLGTNKDSNTLIHTFCTHTHRPA